MLRSMTGYGEANIRSNLGEIRLELKSVNHRFFDSKLNLPRELSSLEPELKKEIRKRIKRGMVFLNLYWENRVSGLGELKLNKELVQSLGKKLKKLQREFKVSSQIPLEAVINFPGVLYFSSSPDRERKGKLIIHRALKKALDNLISSRKEEGRRIEKDIKGRLRLIDKELSRIQQFLPACRVKLRKRFKERLREIQMDKKIDRERLDKEIAFSLIRSDFTEETVRFRSHLKSLHQLILKEASGKNIDFFLQELHREINTLNDKAGEVNISRSAIKIKAELEKLREQSLNLE